MKAKELIAELQKLDPETLIYKTDRDGDIVGVGGCFQQLVWVYQGAPTHQSKQVQLTFIGTQS